MILSRQIPIIFVIYLLYVLAAYVIVGYLHHDEHFQILEFANFKRELVQSQQLPWEFAARIRPALQPTLAVFILNFLDFIKIDDPFFQAFFLRTISAGLFIWSSFKLYRALESEFASPVFKWIFFALTFFFYIFPLTGTRFSSENWSSCFCMLALAFLWPYLKSKPEKSISFPAAIIAGMLFGIAFLFRYQIAIMIFGLAVWLLVFRLEFLKYWLTMLAGFTLIFALGILIDRWFYGDWVLTSWNYFYVNLMEGKAATFGVQPWWWYLAQMDFSKWMIFLNSVLLILVVFFGLLKVKNPVTWMFFAFLIMHFLIDHKETRFLYPIMVYIPFMVTSVLYFLYERVKVAGWSYAFLSPLAVINGLAFLATCFAVTDNSTEIFKYIRTLPNTPVVVYSDDVRFFYTLNDGSHDITPRFYKDDHRVILKDKKTIDVKSPRITRTSDTLKFVVVNWGEEKAVGRELKVAYDPEPGIVKFVNYRNWMRLGSCHWKLYSLNGDQYYTSN